MEPGRSCRTTATPSSWRLVRIPFHHLPVTTETKAATQEARLRALVEDYGVDLVVLARYMQVLSDDLVRRWGAQINIHHGFLPAFKGAKPYHQAWPAASR